MREFSWCQICHHWWHRRLSLWQPSVPPVTTKLVSWRLSVVRSVWSNMLFHRVLSCYRHCIEDFMRTGELHKSFIIPRQPRKQLVFGHLCSLKLGALKAELFQVPDTFEWWRHLWRTQMAYKPINCMIDTIFCFLCCDFPDCKASGIDGVAFKILMNSYQLYFCI